MANMQLTAAEFFGTPVSILDHAGKRWLTADETGHCLGYNDANARQGINNLFKRHEDEFSEEDTCVISLMTQDQARDMRIFSATGCQKLGFFASTARAKDFRTWAAKVLAAGAPTPAAAATPVEARLDRLDNHMATLADTMNMLLTQQNVTGKYIGLLELNQKGTRKVTGLVVQEAKALSAGGMNNADIGRLLRISRTAVSLIVNDKYPHLPTPSTPAEKPLDEILEGVIQREQGKLIVKLLGDGYGNSR